MTPSEFEYRRVTAPAAAAGGFSIVHPASAIHLSVSLPTHIQAHGIIWSYGIHSSLVGDRNSVEACHDLLVTQIDT
jgi:hypothetical protein